MSVRPARAAALRGVVIAGAAVLATACGVPRESGFEPFGPEEGPFPGLSTTTTTTTTTIVPPSSGPATTATIGPRPSSTLVAVEPVQLFFVIDGELTNVSQELARPAALRQVVVSLAEGPPSGSAGTGLQTLVVPGLVTSVVAERGQARVDLDGGLLRQIEPSDQRLLIAQLVLTLGLRPSVGQVSFSADGDPLAIPIPSSDNLLSNPGDAVSYDDYEPLLTSRPAPASTPTASSTPTATSASSPATSTS